MTRTILTSFALVLLLSPAVAHAEDSFWDFTWLTGHSRPANDFQPYYDNGTEPHAGQWKTQLSEENWKPQDWIDHNGGDSLLLVRKFLNAGVITRSYSEGNVPVLDVGPRFYHLSGLDKRRVVMTLDYIYKVTDKKPGVIYLKDASTNAVIGTYTRDGLTLE